MQLMMIGSHEAAATLFFWSVTSFPNSPRLLKGGIAQHAHGALNHGR